MTIKVSEMTAQQKMGNTGAAPSAARNWDFAYTWNSGGTTFTGLFWNFTDTASAAGSLLLDLQVGGVSKLNASKTGYVYGTGTTNVPTYSFVGDADTGLALRSGNLLSMMAGGGETQRWGINISTFISSNIQIGAATYGIRFNSADNTSGSDDTGIYRNSAGVVEVNNGTKGNVRYLAGGGTAVASAAALPLPTGSVFHVTGTTGITSITSTNFQSGVMITLIFDGVLTVTDGGNLKLAGNFTTTADDTLTLVYDGTNWYECCRSVN